MSLFNNKKGFTIVETLIVLAVSSFLFVVISITISGQVQSYRHRDAMYRLQQSVQNTINDVQTGRFIVTGGVDNQVLNGKKVLFCNSQSTRNCSDDSSRENGAVPKANQVKVNTTQSSADGRTTSMASSQINNLPGSIVFAGALAGSSIYSNNEFGFDVRYTNPDSAGAKNEVKIFEYSNYPSISNSELSEYKLCFKGGQFGSLEIGGNELGLNVVLNIQDNECKRIFG